MKSSRRQMLAIAVSLILIAVVGWSKYNELVIYADADNIAGATDDQKLKSFNHRYPSNREIEDHLRDATVVTSLRLTDPNAPNQLYENDLIYSGSGNHFRVWRAIGPSPAGGLSNEYHEGDWKLFGRLLISHFRGQTHFKWIQLFCVGGGNRSLDSRAECPIVEDLSRLFSWSGEQRDFRRGDVFGVSQATELSFKIPATAPISIKSLEALASKAQK